jgi:hypothetical protein
VIPAGFEPATYSLEGGCSIQLSYGIFTYIELQRFVFLSIDSLNLYNKNFGILNMIHKNTMTYDYKMLRIVIFLLTFLSIIFLMFNSSNYGNYKRGMFNGTYLEYINNYKRSPDFSNDKFNKKVLFFMSNPINSTIKEQQITNIINSNFAVGKNIPQDLALIKIVIGEYNLDGKYKVIIPNTFLLLDELGKEIKRSNAINSIDDVKEFIK